jgi:hypothetical protein
MYPLGYIEDFFVKADAVAAPISPPAAEGTFEMGSSAASKKFVQLDGVHRICRRIISAATIEKSDEPSTKIVSLRPRSQIPL